MMTVSRTLILSLTWATAGFYALPGVAAEGAYPTRPVRVIVPFPPGSSDVAARLLARKISDKTGQQFIIDNRPGATGAIGTNTAAKAQADGYTLLYHTCTLTIGAAMSKSLPYRVPEDFDAVALAVYSPMILVANPTVPVNSVKDLIALAKMKPGELNYGSIGPGSLAYLTAEMFKSRTGVRITEVTYQGTAPAVTALISGEVQIMFSVLGASLPYVRSGRLKAIAIASPKRSALLSDLPTVAESGVPDFDALCWHGVMAPHGTPQNVINILNSHIVTALNSPDMQVRLAAMGLESAPSSAQQFDAFLKAQMVKWRQIIKSSGVALKN